MEGTQEYTSTQKEVADGAREVILANLEHHITIAELAKTLHVSPTHVKVSFQKVYGTPVYTYARARRMEHAAELLADTEDSILEIAEKVGYENGSKFAGAFRKVMGESPSQYRHRIRWEREEAARFS